MELSKIFLPFFLFSGLAAQAANIQKPSSFGIAREIISDEAMPLGQRAWREIGEAASMTIEGASKTLIHSRQRAILDSNNGFTTGHVFQVSKNTNGDVTESAFALDKSHLPTMHADLFDGGPEKGLIVSRESILPSMGVLREDRGYDTITVNNQTWRVLRYSQDQIKLGTFTTGLAKVTQRPAEGSKPACFEIEAGPFKHTLNTSEFPGQVLNWKVKQVEKDKNTAVEMSFWTLNMGRVFEHKVTLSRDEKKPGTTTQVKIQRLPNPLSEHAIQEANLLADRTTFLAADSVTATRGLQVLRSDGTPRPAAANDGAR